MKGIIFIMLICGAVLFSGCTQTGANTANAANATSTTVINATCSDGTPEKACSANKPFYCAGGELLKNAEKCGCAYGYTLSAGSCVKLCPDGTVSGQCTHDKSKYCSEGSLVTDYAKCGCNSSVYDLKGGVCVIARCGDNTTLNSCSNASASFLCNASGSLVKNPGRCGCQSNYTASGNDCLKDCSDGTAAGQCNSAIKFCDNGTLTLNATKCPCPSGKVACGDSCAVPNCTSDSDCYDGNSNTSDKCLGPGTCNATCLNDYYQALVYDSDESPVMHNLKFSIDAFDSIGRYFNYTSTNGTDLSINTTSSKKFIEVSVTIDAKRDYDYEVSQDSFYLIDDENITYSPICASKSNKMTGSTSSCYNEGAFDSYDSLAEDDNADGYLYFEIPKSNDPRFFAFMFDDSLKPGEIWFRYD
jgi:hypothetical protein